MLAKSFLVALSLFAVSAVGHAQQPNPLDAVPEKMPFDLPYGEPIKLDRAQTQYRSSRFRR